MTVQGWRPPVYISGPMRGKPQHNYPLFALVAADLRAHGWTVENPAEHFGGKTDRQIHEYLASDVISLILYARGIVMLPGWEDSEGSRLELQIAMNLQYEAFCWEPGRGLLFLDRTWAARVLASPQPI